MNTGKCKFEIDEYHNCKILNRKCNEIQRVYCIYYEYYEEVTE